MMRNDFLPARAMTTHRDASFYAVAMFEPSRSRWAKRRGVSERRRFRRSSWPRTPPPLPAPYSSRVSIALSHLPPTRAAFSNDRATRTTSHCATRGNPCSRSVRFERIAFRPESRSVLKSYPTVPRLRLETVACLPRWDQDLMRRDLLRRFIYAIEFLAS